MRGFFVGFYKDSSEKIQFVLIHAFNIYDAKKQAQIKLESWGYDYILS